MEDIAKPHPTSHQAANIVTSVALLHVACGRGFAEVGRRATQCSLGFPEAEHTCMAAKEC
eukprot:942440-Amphidinium_carterae.1